MENLNGWVVAAAAWSLLITVATGFILFAYNSVRQGISINKNENEKTNARLGEATNGLNVQITQTRDRMHELANKMSGDYMQRPEIEQKISSTESRMKMAVDRLEARMDEMTRDIKSDIARLFEFIQDKVK